MTDIAPLFSLCLASARATAPDALWSSWSLAPAVVVPLALALGLYVHGARVLRARGGAALPPWKTACFAAGWLVLALALVSPLCRLAATLVSAHMVQHVLLVAVAPLLLVLAAPLTVIRAGLPAAWRATADTAATRSPTRLRLPIALLYGAAIWLWHAPPVYSAVLLDPVIHALGYAALLAVSLLFWHSVLSADATARGKALLDLFVTLVHTGVLGALLTFSPRLWYPVLADGAAVWGMSAHTDQQLAGLIMWVPMGFIYLLVGLVLAAGLLSNDERRDPAQSMPLRS